MPPSVPACALGLRRLEGPSDREAVAVNPFTYDARWRDWWVGHRRVRVATPGTDHTTASLYAVYVPILHPWTTATLKRP